MVCQAPTDSSMTFRPPPGLELKVNVPRFSSPKFVEGKSLKMTKRDNTICELPPAPRALAPQQPAATKLRQALSQPAENDCLKDSSGGERCTWMVRNLPSRVTQEEFIIAVNELGFEGKYDFFYMPFKMFKSHRQNRGYAFVGFSSTSAGYEFYNAMTGYRFIHRQSTKIVELTPARMQTLDEMEQHFKGKLVTTSLYAPKVFGTQEAEEQAQGDSAPDDAYAPKFFGAQALIKNPYAEIVQAVEPTWVSMSWSPSDKVSL